MKKKMFIGVYIIHEIVCLYFCLWYLALDGYLGFGYGDMFYVLPIIVITFFSSVALFLINRFEYHVRLFLGLLFLVIDAFVLYLYFQS